MKKIKYIALAAIAALSSCNFLEVEPIGQVIPHKYSEYRALLTEGYRIYNGTQHITYTGVLCDEVGLINMDAFYGDAGQGLQYNYTWDYANNNMQNYAWKDLYTAIFQANAVISGLPNADKDGAESREQIMGEAHALRALTHFGLINTYGKWYDPATAATDRGVPISIRIDIEQIYKPASVKAVYEQILSDITSAEGLLDVDFQPITGHTYRFSKRGLAAFKSRVLLYMSNFQGAYDAAISIIEQCPLQNLEGLTTSDKKLVPWCGTSIETIMALDKPFAGGGGDITAASILSQKMLDLVDPEKDNRRKFISEKNRYDENWNPIFVGYALQRTYGDPSTFRSAEIYLTAAESAAHLPGKLDLAKGYLKTLLHARLKPTAIDEKVATIDAMNQAELIEEIANERAREFMGEGHRWFDLRRTTRPEIVKTYEGNTYTLARNDSRYTLPFPRSAVDSNPELGR